MMSPAESEDGVVRTGAVTSAVSALVRSVFDGGTSADELAAALDTVEHLAVSAEALHLDDRRWWRTPISKPCSQHNTAFNRPVR